MIVMIGRDGCGAFLLSIIPEVREEASAMTYSLTEDERRAFIRALEHAATLPEPGVST